jgi:hypothetical protein
MKPRHWLLGPLFVVGLVVTNGGCLSIVGRTINENPETSSRLKALETRVSALEQVLDRPPAPAP